MPHIYVLLNIFQSCQAGQIGAFGRLILALGFIFDTRGLDTQVTTQCVCIGTWVCFEIIYKTAQHIYLSEFVFKGVYVLLLCLTLLIKKRKKTIVLEWKEHQLTRVVNSGNFTTSVLAHWKLGFLFTIWTSKPSLHHKQCVSHRAW